MAAKKKKAKSGTVSEPYRGYQVNDASLSRLAKQKLVAGEARRQRQLFRLDPVLKQHAVTRAKDLPVNMRKYWNNRHDLFSLFDGSSESGEIPLLDAESWYSVTPEAIAARIAERCRCETIVDAFCGAGGNAIQFAFTCERVIAIDVDPIKIALARWNAKVYGVEDRITFLVGDYFEYVKACQLFRKEGIRSDATAWQGCETSNIDVIFLSPPWGGVTYRDPSTIQTVEQTGEEPEQAQSEPSPAYYPLSLLAPSGGKAMFEASSNLTCNVAMFLPRNVDLNEVVRLVTDDETKASETTTERVIVDVEEQFMGKYCKALSCYFGDLTEFNGSW